MILIKGLAIFGVIVFMILVCVGLAALNTFILKWGNWFPLIGGILNGCGAGFIITWITYYEKI